MENRGVRSPEPQPTGAPRPPGVAWERDGAAFPLDLLRSWMACMTRPFQFFGRVSVETPFTRPLLFFLVFATVGHAVGLLSFAAVFADAYDTAGTGYGPGSGSSVSLLLGLLFVPFYSLFLLAVYTCITHAGVRLFVPDARDIGATARGLCYVAAPQVVSIVPLVGWMAASAWALFLAVVSVHRLHRTSIGRAVAAVLVPAATLATVLLMLGIAVAFLIVAAMGGVL